MSINRPLESYIHELVKQHLDANLELYVDGKLTAGEIRVLTTKRVGDAWGHVKKQNILLNIHLKKCGLTKNLDGSKDALINIKSIKGYKMPCLKTSSRRLKKLTVNMMMIGNLFFCLLCIAVNSEVNSLSRLIFVMTGLYVGLTIGNDSIAFSRQQDQ